ncbi:hypothetical protein E8E14_006964 [Neopestalotiopsis sp. 37M]|nr:hypothetical protein E8E14_006964 [Neopestalotiopsis sp. 37M]
MSVQSDIIAKSVRWKLKELKWIPQNFGRELLETRAIDTLLEEIKSNTQGLKNEETKAFKDFVSNKAPQLCVMLIRFKVIELIEKFYHRGIMDSHFPVNAKQDDDDPNRLHITNPQTTLEIDELSSDRLFCSENPAQHQFFVPILKWKGINDPPLMGRLPFLIEPLTISTTDFSIVRKSTIHRQHIDIRANGLKIEVDKDNNPLVAIKELLQTKMTSSQFDMLIRFEYNCLSKLRTSDFDTPHLIKASACYRKGDSLFFVFPWAPHGNLLKFWQDKEPKANDQIYVKWLFDQLLGLSRTVQRLHDAKNNIRHGDLKPENILCFECSDSKVEETYPPYVFVISDVGLAKEHDRVTQLRGRSQLPGGGTMVYAAPEMETHENRATSRRYDIWSLGCIYLEFIVWLLYGIEGLKRFSEHRKGRFYRIQDNKNALRPGGNVKTAELDPVVLDWISEAIRGSRSAPNKVTAVSCILEIIRDRLLVIDANPDYVDLESSDHDEGMSMSPISRVSTSESTDQPASQSVDNPSFKFDRALTDLERKMSNERAYASEICSKISEIVRQAETGEIEWVSLGGSTLQIPPASPLSPDGSALKVNEVSTDNKHQMIELVFDVLLVHGMLEVLIYCPVSGVFIDTAQLNDLSEYAPDKETSAEVVDSFAPLASANKESNLCTRCRHLPIVPHDVVLEATMHVLMKESSRCDLCRLVCHVFKGRATTPNDLLRFFRVPRKLGVDYLWIDSLCIVQAEPGNPEDKDKGQDFLKEAGKMELVFSSAYATIAATCAGSPAEHFLKRRPERQFATIPTDRGPYYLAEVIDKFSEDVDQSELNSRGWVFQERALSRRTIYFAENQTYWECGKGIRCETLTRTENIKSALLGDANFPFTLPDFDKGRRIKLFQSLYERYTKLKFTYPTDRPIAIRGLETRLLRALDTLGGYGIFEQYMRRGLLWQREGSNLPRIDFSKNCGGNAHEPVPSWSWMAYDGPIRYMEIPAAAEWKAWHADVRSPWEQDEFAKPTVLRVLVRNIVDFEAGSRVILDEPEDIFKHDFKCVVVGSKRAPDPMQADVYYSLIVTPLQGDGHICQRAGVAFLEGRNIDWESPAVAMHFR